jgi:hypothetical protein
MASIPKTKAKYFLDSGLGKVPQRLQNALFASSSIYAENINDKIVIRSSECEYAVEKVRLYTVVSIIQISTSNRNIFPDVERDYKLFKMQEDFP